LILDFAAWGNFGPVRIIARDESNVRAAAIDSDGRGAGAVDVEPFIFGHWDQAKKVRTAQGRGLTASRSAYEEMRTRSLSAQRHLLGAGGCRFREHSRHAAQLNRLRREAVGLARASVRGGAVKGVQHVLAESHFLVDHDAWEARCVDALGDAKVVAEG
jgi:hypothetical protein